MIPARNDFALLLVHSMAPVVDSFLYLLGVEQHVFIALEKYMDRDGSERHPFALLKVVVKCKVGVVTQQGLYFHKVLFRNMTLFRSS